MNQPIVLSISSVSGGGKTTVTKKLAEALPHTKSLHFDDYCFDDIPQELIEWVKSGADYNQWNLTPLVKDVQSLLHEEKKELSYILLDYPFAYRNSEMADFIDFAVFLDTPLDVALARRIMRDDAKHTIEEVIKDLSFYLAQGRAGYLEMENSIKPNADIVVNGANTPEIIVNQIIKRIERIT